MQNGAGGGHPRQAEQALQQRSSRASLAKGTGQGIEATIIHTYCPLRASSLE
jgi:hypothetical protein